ncbi:MAG: dihydroorotase [Dethiobacteria bacterium]|jgi:dihydroorotase
MKRVILKGGRLIDPSFDLNKVCDLVIENGLITELAEDIKAEAHEEVIDLRGKVVVPGFIDMHVHLREPGQESKETIYTGCQAAVAGGFTAVACMPNTVPVVDNKVVIEYIKKEAERVSLAKVYPIGAITKGCQGQELAEIGRMVEHGIRAVSDDGQPVKEAELMRSVLEYTRMFAIPVINHCEDPSLIGLHGINEGRISTILGLAGAPTVAETTMVARDLLLAEYTGGWVHIAHVSTATSVELIRRAKERGVRVTAEVTPHHLLLTEEAVDGYNTQAKMNPPLRTEEDRLALIAGLREGVIDLIATDHAPHGPEEKEEDFISAPSGVAGLETAVPLLLTELVAKGLLSLEQLVDRLSRAPARVLGVPGGTLACGQPADITVLDLEREAVITAERFYSKGKNTPFEGWAVKGMPFLTIVDGEVKMKESRVLK